jgi:hypothetical protein
MASLRHDKDGFLVGKNVEIDPQIFGKALEVWSSIKSDTAAIRAALTGGKARRPSQESRQASAAVVAVPVGGGSARSAMSNATQQALKKIAAQGAARPAPRQMRSDVALVVARGTDGRFISQKVATPNRARDSAKATAQARGASGQSGGGESVGNGRASDAASALKEAASSLAHVADGADDIDPAIKATKEVGDVLRPVAGAFGGLFKGAKGIWGFFRRNKGDEEKRVAVPWYRRIWNELRGINGKSGGGLGGMIMAVLSAVAALTGFLLGLPALIASGLLKLLPMLLAKLGIGRALGGGLGASGAPGAGAGRGGWRDKAKAIGRNLKSAVKFGGPLAALLAALDAYQTERNDDLSREEKNRQHAKTGGAGVGAVIGGGLGLIAGPVGAIVGSLLGGIIGDMVGEWLHDLDWKEIGRSITGAWDATISWMKDAWTSTLKSASDAFDSVGNWVSEKAGTAWRRMKDNAAIMFGDEPDGINRVVETGNGYSVVRRQDGTLERRQGARNWRNNNPGNIEFGEFARSAGAIGTDGRFAVFPSVEAGRKALESKLFEAGDYRNLKLSDAVARYAPAGENDTAAYSSALLSAVGGSDRRMGDYSQQDRRRIMDAIERREGFNVGMTKALDPIQSAVASLPKSPLGMSFHQAGTAALVVGRIPTTRMSAAISSETTAIPASAETSRTPIASNAGRPVQVTVAASSDVGQNVSDRGMAQIVTGGLGGYVNNR